MASEAATVVISMIVDDVLKDGGRAEAIKVMEGDCYKRRVMRKKSHANMGSVVPKVAAKQVAKQAARQVAKRVTKQAVTRLAIRGVKELGKGAAVAAVGVGADAAINKMNGNRKCRRKMVGHRKLCGGRRYRKKEVYKQGINKEDQLVYFYY